MSSLHVCYNCGKIMPGEVCQTCAPISDNDIIPANWKSLFHWLETTAWAIDLMQEIRMLVLSPNGVYHVLQYCRLPDGDYEMMIDHGTWSDGKEFDFVMFEFWPEGVRK